MECLVAEWLKRCTADLEVPGFSPTRQQTFLSLQGALGPDPKLRRRVTFVSFGGPGVNRLLPSQALIGDHYSGQYHSHRLRIVTAVTAGQDSGQLLSVG